MQIKRTGFNTGPGHSLPSVNGGPFGALNVIIVVTVCIPAIAENDCLKVSGCVAGLAYCKSQYTPDL